MNCSDIQEQLSVYHDGELNSEMREVVAAHVADCDQCASRLAEFASYSKSFRELSQPAVPPTVCQGITKSYGRRLANARCDSNKLIWRSKFVLRKNCWPRRMLPTKRSSW